MMNQAIRLVAACWSCLCQGAVDIRLWEGTFRDRHASDVPMRSRTASGRCGSERRPLELADAVSHHAVEPRSGSMCRVVICHESSTVRGPLLLLRLPRMSPCGLLQSIAGAVVIRAMQLNPMSIVVRSCSWTLPHGRAVEAQTARLKFCQAQAVLLQTAFGPRW
eukprot:10783624-Alexandrium_andersonii.AAC.1